MLFNSKSYLKYCENESLHFHIVCLLKINSFLSFSWGECLLWFIISNSKDVLFVEKELV